VLHSFFIFFHYLLNFYLVVSYMFFFLQGHTPLHVASFANAIESATTLISKRAPIDAQVSERQSFFYFYKFYFVIITLLFLLFLYI
jgi:hypothetical protein